MSTANGVKAHAKRNGKKPQKKPSRLPPHLVPGNPGNVGGKAGRSGRKPDDFKAMCKAACDEVVLPKVLKYLNTEKSDPKDPWFWKCADYVSNYGLGKPAQTVTVAGDPDAPLAFTLALGEGVLE